MLTWFKWLIAGQELQELYRWRIHHGQYRRWLAEFGDVGLVLDNLEAEVRGDQLDMNVPPSSIGPWTVEALREVLRQRAEREKVTPPAHVRQPMRRG